MQGKVGATSVRDADGGGGGCFANVQQLRAVQRREFCAGQGGAQTKEAVQHIPLSFRVSIAALINVSSNGYCQELDFAVFVDPVGLPEALGCLKKCQSSQLASRFVYRDGPRLVDVDGLQLPHLHMLVVGVHHDQRAAPVVQGSLHIHNMLLQTLLDAMR